MWPKEHGSWAVLLAPIVVGFAAAGGVSPGVAAAFLLAAFGAFCLRAPLQSLAGPRPDPGARAWLFGFAAVAALGAAPLLFVWGRWGLGLLAAPAAVMLAFNIRANLERRTFSAINEAGGILTLCLGAPAAYYAASGGFPPAAWCAWLLSSLYFLGPIFHVKMAALQHRAAADAAALPALARMRALSAAWHAAALAGVAAAAAFASLPALLVLPFAAALFKTWRRAQRPAGRVDFRRLGYQEVAYAALFTLVSALAVGPGRCL